MHLNKSLKILIVFVFTMGIVYAGSKFLSVQVQSARVRSAPNFFMSKVVDKLKFGEKVTVLRSKDGWYKVKLPNNKTGWMSTSALTAKTFKLKAGGRDAQVQAGNEELALAGRGFSGDVEKSFRQNNQLNYKWVDWMQANPDYKISIEEMKKFLIDGEVIVPFEKGDK